MEQTILEEEKSKSFDIKGYFLKLGKSYYWLIIAIALCVGGAYFYMRYTTPTYIITTNVLTQQPDETANKLGSAFQNTGTNTNTNTAPDLNNEIFKFQSTSVVGEVVDSLRLDVLLTTKVNDKTIPVYIRKLPFKLTLKKANPENESSSYKLFVFNTSYRLEQGDEKMIGVYNQPLIVNGDTLFYIQRNRQ